MRGFIPRTTLYKKAAAMAVVVGGLGAGLHLFSSYQDALENFRWYHLQAHGVAMGNTLQQVERSTASAALALTRGEQLRYTQHNDVKPAQSIPVLVYHGVMARSEGNNIALEKFTEQLLALQAAGYQTVSLDDFSQFMRGDKELPDQSFLLTFDDGRKDSFYPVDPILKALDYHAVMFVITKHALGGDSRRSHFYLSERELKNMLNTGRWDIQSHGKDDHDFYAIDDQDTQGHFLSNRLYLEERGRIESSAEFGQRIFTDLTISKRELEDTLGRAVISFAYPFGDFGQNPINFPESEVFIADAVHSVYDFAFYQGWPELGDTFNYPDPDAFMIKRINVQPHWSGEHLVKRLDRGRAKKLPYEDDFAQDNGWIKIWGRSDMTDGSLELSSVSVHRGGGFTTS
jgi:peptidoglycan/xylan/chitin deacetylase (PgdA/CDA1 family)